MIFSRKARSSLAVPAFCVWNRPLFNSKSARGRDLNLCFYEGNEGPAGTALANLDINSHPKCGMPPRPATYKMTSFLQMRSSLEITDKFQEFTPRRSNLACQKSVEHTFHNVWSAIPPRKWQVRPGPIQHLVKLARAHGITLSRLLTEDRKI